MSQQPITPALIKELRDRTGIGMGNCKEALEEAKGDIELAISNLRKKGMASAVKKEGRAANEGIIGVAETPQNIAVIEVNAETDFVVKNDRFQKFVEELAKEVAQTKPTSLEAFLSQKFSKDPSLTIDEYRATLVQAIGENIQLKRLLVIPKEGQKSIGAYSHLGGKIVTLVEISGSDKEEDLAKKIAMHVVAASPEYVSPDQVPQEVITQEKEIISSQLKGKPANMMEKIIEGKLKAYYDANCLVCQKYIRDDSKSVQEFIDEEAKKNGHPLKVIRFIRWNVGQ